MRWLRRGHLFLVGVILLLVILMEILRSRLISDGFHSHQMPQLNSSQFLIKRSKSPSSPNKALLACTNNEVEVLLMVPSAVENKDARAAVRKSWSPLLPSSWVLVFFLGLTDDVILQDQVIEEARKFEDIIQDSRFTDSYLNLTLKSLALLQWTQTTCTSAKYLIKIDDDMYLNIPKLHHLLECINEARTHMYSKNKDLTKTKYINNTALTNKCSDVNSHQLLHYYIDAETQEYESYLFGGYLYEGVKPDRNEKSKWYLDDKLYSHTVLPPFLSGTAYMLSTNLIKHLLDASKQEPLIHLEDVYVTGLVGSKSLKLKLSHVNGWSRFRPRWNSVCLFKELLTVHGLSPSELPTLTSKVINLDGNECNSLIVQISNLLNTFISSVIPRIA